MPATEEAHAAGGAAFETMGPPGHTPFRSSRFMPPPDDSGDGQVPHASVMRLLPWAVLSGTSCPRLPVHHVLCTDVHARKEMALLQDAANALVEPGGEVDMPDADGKPGSSSAPGAEEAGAPSAPGQPDHAPTGAAAGMDGAAPVTQRPQKRMALPQHALLATQLQVRPRASKAWGPHQD